MAMFWSSLLVGLALADFIVGSPLSPNAKTSFIRIVGGQDANIQDYPYQVSIMLDSSHVCGGSILTTTFILSAAHCFYEVSSPSRFTIRVGSSSRTSGGTVLQVLKINSHSSFNFDTFDYDVAVVQLASAMTFGTGVQPIQLPTATTSFSNGQIAVATGWGYVANDGPLASVLQVVTIPLITTTTCRTKYYGSDPISDRMICAGSAGKDSCTGDSGGPLVSNGIQLGIVSWGDVCGQASTPGVYTKITEFLTYINGIIGSSRSLNSTKTVS
ncbi:trypsin-4-like [Anthonomus grandis grandis]|uniref:trypsin-4-like n=1 Tax=Anthonomus grandis grandis TaxID=2921223 RepID=UPI002166AC5A|nr:trypsin-4-like [Anthonomus grandis grandis]